jgi:hypothetical protein
VTRIARAGALAAALLFSAVAAVAQAPAVEGKWWKRPRIAEALQLSADQVGELEKIFARVKPKLIDLRADLEKKQFAYDQAMSSEKADRAHVEIAHRGARAGALGASEGARADGARHETGPPSRPAREAGPDARERAEPHEGAAPQDARRVAVRRRAAGAGAHPRPR